jgi:hypothetical protein
MPTKFWSRSFGRSRRKWEDHDRMDLREVGWEGMVDWIHVARDKSPVTGSCEHSNETYGSIKKAGNFLTI